MHRSLVKFRLIHYIADKFFEPYIRMSEHSKQYRFTDDTRFDFNTSYNQDDAIRYLMNGLQGNFREDISEAGHEEDLGEFSYCDMLEDLFEKAKTSHGNARAIRKLFQKGTQDVDDKKVSDEKFQEIENELIRATEQLNKYHEYKCDIADEFAKGDKSELRKDLSRTKNPDFPYITISSLKAWKKNKYPDVDYQSKKPRTQMRDQGDAILDAIKSLGHDPFCLPQRVNGHRWVKADVRELLKGCDLFTAHKSFDNAWQKLVEEGIIVEGDEPYYKKVK